MMAALSHIGPDRIPQWIDACLMVDLGLHGVAAGYLRDAGDPAPRRAVLHIQSLIASSRGQDFEAASLERASHHGRWA